MADDLTPLQHNAISALLSARTLKAAAKAAGCGERTLRGWLDEPAFVAAYQHARRAAVGQAIARLQQVSAAAVDRLQHLLTHGTPAVQLGAARTILELAIKSVEIEDLQSRIEALEQAHAKQTA